MRRVTIAGLVLAGLMVAGLVGPALADETTGTIQAYDRLDHLIVLKDKTVWSLPGALPVPADLKAGDKVRIVYTAAGDSGIIKIDTLTRLDD